MDTCRYLNFRQKRRSLNVLADFRQKRNLDKNGGCSMPRQISDKSGSRILLWASRIILSLILRRILRLISSTQCAHKKRQTARSWCSLPLCAEWAIPYPTPSLRCLSVTLLASDSVYCVYRFCRRCTACFSLDRRRRACPRLSTRCAWCYPSK